MPLYNFEFPEFDVSCILLNAIFYTLILLLDSHHYNILLFFRCPFLVAHKMQHSLLLVFKIPTFSTIKSIPMN